MESEGEDREATRFSHELKSLTILICGHMSRDSRCGILGPILQAEFEKQLQRTEVSHMKNAAVGLCSHIGGHAFAGNVIMYIPKEFRSTEGGEISPLAGKGVWYGRVEPRHVEGILEETIKGGRIIQELLRGVHDPLDDRISS